MFVLLFKKPKYRLLSLSLCRRDKSSRIRQFIFLYVTLYFTEFVVKGQYHLYVRVLYIFVVCVCVCVCAFRN